MPITGPYEYNIKGYLDAKNLKMVRFWFTQAQVDLSDVDFRQLVRNIFSYYFSIDDIERTAMIIQEIGKYIDNDLKEQYYKKNNASKKIINLLENFQFTEADIYYRENTDLINRSKKLETHLSKFNFWEVAIIYKKNAQYISSNTYEKLKGIYLAIFDRINRERVVWEKTKDYLNKNKYFDADNLILSSIPDAIEKYNNLKYGYVVSSLRSLEKKLGIKDGYFDNEKASVLSKTGHSILVRARAGSGKTTTIALKVRQIFNCYGAKPEEIIVLAFNRNAAKEFVDRINKYCDSKIAILRENCSTFHSFAYRLVNPGEQLIFNDFQENSEFVVGQQTNFIGKIYNQILTEDRGTILTLLYNFFKSVGRNRAMMDFESTEAFYLYRRNLEYVSLAGERVKSRGEKFIADFLFEHKITKNSRQIEYKYEWNLPGGNRRYKPDFSLRFMGGSRSDLPAAILEFFGVTEKHRASRDYMSIDEEQKYLQEMEWKKQYCLRNNIPLILTSVDDFDNKNDQDERLGFEQIIKRRMEREGFLLERIERMEIKKKMLENEVNINNLFKQITQFINRAKKQSLSPYDIQRIAEINSNLIDGRVSHFLKIARRVYDRYQKELKKENKIDFDDLLLRAIDKINQTKGECEIEINDKLVKINSIKFILIDEYQDFSPLFYKLIESIRENNSSVSIFCVGDDWQAINGFAGSDLNYFNNFKNYFPDGCETSLLTNYRSAKDIVAHSNLIMAGLGEGGKPDPAKPRGAVHLFETMFVNWKSNHQNDEDEKYRIAAQNLVGAKGGNRIEISRYLKSVDQIIKNKTGVKTCLLFRTNTLFGLKISDFTAQIKKWNPSYREDYISCSTAHSFKGKESNVIILVGAIRGDFPKIHPDNELMELLGVTLADVLREERRLFYVALTRATEELYLLYDTDNGLSDFINIDKWPYLRVFLNDAALKYQIEKRG